MKIKNILFLIVFLLSSCQSIKRVLEPQKGSIMGKIIYPGEMCPNDIKAVAVNILDGKKYEYQPFKKASDNKLGFKPKYVLKLPPGTYEVYATSDLSFEKGYKAYYTEFVKCGMSVSCTSHKIIQLKINKGDKLENITLGDWYIK